MSDKEILRLSAVTKVFGSFRALDGVNLTVGAGEILGLVGPNGSGKTTCINVISGLYQADQGQILFRGHPINQTSANRRVHHGINRTYQIPKPFQNLTVEENVHLALKFGKAGRTVVEDPLDFVGLTGVAQRLARSLNSIQQKLLDLARALATGPDLLLVDELAAGLSPQEMQNIANKLLGLSHQGLAMIVVEHHMTFINQLTQRVLVMNAGKEIFEGSLRQAAANEQVVSIYLGTRHSSEIGG